MKTKSVHFHVQRESNFGSPGVIPFQSAPLNEGGAMNVTSGIFTAPVAGIYHFEFSGLKSPSSTYLHIKIQVNGASVATADTNPGVTGSNDSVSLTASLRLKANDTVNLYNWQNGVLLDYGGHFNNFAGWLVEEDF